jgi:hypothetical protein
MPNEGKGSFKLKNGKKKALKTGIETGQMARRGKKTDSQRR